jgi:hypothetical protein
MDWPVQAGTATRPPPSCERSLVADSEFIAGWRNLGQIEAELFWIVSARSQ